MECEYCGKKEVYGYTCSYCGKRCCSDHKIPEMHDCRYIGRIAKPVNPRHIPKKSIMERVDSAIFYLDKDERLKKYK